MTVAESIARWLHEKGITHAFGIVGGGNVALWAAITDLGKTQLICCHHEQAAAMAASYYYRQSGRMALALVTTGAGSSNAITGVLAAFFDSIPLLVISGNEPSNFLAQWQRVKGYQGYPSAFWHKPFCKSTGYMHVGLNMDLLEEQYQIALAPRQGPVWLDIPKNVQVEKCLESKTNAVQG